MLRTWVSTVRSESTSRSAICRLVMARPISDATSVSLGDSGLAAEAAAEFRRLALPGPLTAADALLTRIDSAARAASPLSPRETEVASLIARAMTNRQIAEQLVLSERTVETHVRSILAKLGYTTRTEIATWSLRSS